MDYLANGAEVVSLFCRVNINTKRELPIRQSEMGLLMFITQSETPPTSLDAVRFFKVSKPMVASMVRSLERKGYIERGQHPGDQRRFTLLLTDKAGQLVSETTSEYFKNMAILRDGLGEQDYDALLDLLNRANRLLLDEKAETKGAEPTWGK